MQTEVPADWFFTLETPCTFYTYFHHSNIAVSIWKGVGRGLASREQEIQSFTVV